MVRFVKRNRSAPPGFFACEAAGLQWLSAVTGGVSCARVLEQDGVSLALGRLHSVPASPAAAREFGMRLAVTHGAGAAAFGAAPDGWSGPGYFGPLAEPMPMSLTSHARWGEFYADERLLPMAERAAARLDAETRADIDAVVSRCRASDFDDGTPPDRLHGDLWSGNVIWTADGVVLVDPAAHGGHRETDLAMLALFGCPYLDTVYDGYQSVRPLRPGWRRRAGLHQLYPLLAHVVLFGDAYGSRLAAAARSALALPGGCSTP
jgi:fructosamine-3-kinase